MSRKTVRTPTVEFARRGAAAQAEGDVVRVRGVIFRAGVYPNQSYAMTADDMRATAAEFSPVPLDLGHPSAASPMDGKFGHLESVEVSPDGSTMFGTVAIHKWFKDQLGDAKLRVSASFDRATKRLRALSLVTNPQIEDAALAAFCACQAEPDPAEPTTPTKEASPMPTKKELALAKLREMDEAENEGVFDALLGESAPEPEADDIGDGTDDAPTPAEFALHQRIAQLERENELARLANFAQRAEAFADAQVAACRLVPGEKARVVELHTQAAIDDHERPAQFSAAGGKSRVVAFEATIAARTPHSWTKESVASFGRVLDGGADGPESDAAKQSRVNEWLKLTPEGRARLAEKQNGAARA